VGNPPAEGGPEIAGLSRHSTTSGPPFVSETGGGVRGARSARPIRWAVTNVSPAASDSGGRPRRARGRGWHLGEELAIAKLSSGAWNSSIPRGGRAIFGGNTLWHPLGLGRSAGRPVRLFDLLETAGRSFASTPVLPPRSLDAVPGQFRAICASSRFPCASFRINRPPLIPPEGCPRPR